MNPCKHTNLTLLPGAGERLRCRECHLTIEKNELDNGYCPECFEAFGKKQYEFEPVAATGQAVTRYRCESCGAIIVCD